MKKTYHLGRFKYLVFYGKHGLLEEINIKEWDGEKVIREGVKLNISRFIRILHSIEIVEHSLEKIIKCESDRDIKIHIGASYYITCNSPSRSVAIRL